eukprot:4538928-Ditylum_brightwellii.AAC.1
MHLLRLEGGTWTGMRGRHKVGEGHVCLGRMLVRPYLGMRLRVDLTRDDETWDMMEEQLRCRIVLGEDYSTVMGPDECEPVLRGWHWQ